MSRYDDIIDRPHHVSKKHPPLSADSRAAQFSPFAALTGYGDAVEEAARLTDGKIDLGPDEVERIDAVLKTLARGDTVKAVHFVPDARKTGGSYRDISGTVKKIDALRRALVFEDGRTIAFEDILTIERKE